MCASLDRSLKIVFFRPGDGITPYMRINPTKLTVDELMGYGKKPAHAMTSSGHDSGEQDLVNRVSMLRLQEHSV